MGVAVHRPPQEGTYPGEQLLEREGLDEVVVGAGVEPGDPVRDRVARREHQDGCPVPLPPHSPADGQPVDRGHEDVEDDQLRLLAPDRLEGAHPVLRERDLVAVERQRAPQRDSDGGLVVRDQDAHGRSVVEPPERFLKARVTGP